MILLSRDAAFLLLPELATGRSSGNGSIRIHRCNEYWASKLSSVQVLMAVRCLRNEGWMLRISIMLDDLAWPRDNQQLVNLCGLAYYVQGALQFNILNTGVWTRGCPMRTACRICNARVIPGLALTSKNPGSVLPTRCCATNKDQAPMAAKLGRLVPSQTALFVCDVQERFRPIISGFDAVVDVSRRMVCTFMHTLRAAVMDMSLTQPARLCCAQTDTGCYSAGHTCRGDRAVP